MRWVGDSMGNTKQRPDPFRNRASPSGFATLPLIRRAGQCIHATPLGTIKNWMAVDPHVGLEFGIFMGYGVGRVKVLKGVITVLPVAITQGGMR